MGTEVQGSQESLPVTAERSKEMVRATLSQLEQEYVGLTNNKDISAWKQLGQKFKDNESFKTTEHLSPFERAEFARKEAFIAYHILELKYEPQRSVLPHPISEKLKHTSASERKADYHSTQEAIRLYDEVLRSFEGTGISSDNESYQKAVRGREGSILIEKMFEAFENGVQDERVRIQRDVSDFLKTSLSLASSDEVVVETTTDGTEVEITVMKNGQDVSVLELGLDYSNSDNMYVKASVRYTAKMTGAFIRGGLDGKELFADNVIQVINGQHSQYPRYKK